MANMSFCECMYIIWGVVNFLSIASIHDETEYCLRVPLFQTAISVYSVLFKIRE